MYHVSGYLASLCLMFQVTWHHCVSCFRLPGITVYHVSHAYYYHLSLGLILSVTRRYSVSMLQLQPVTVSHAFVNHVSLCRSLPVTRLLCWSRFRLPGVIVSDALGHYVSLCLTLLLNMCHQVSRFLLLRVTVSHASSRHSCVYLLYHALLPRTIVILC